MLEALKQTRCADVRAWVESHLSFPPAVSPNHPGNVSLERQPWMAEILEAVLDPALEHLYLVMGTQTGKTTACMLATALLAEFDPAPLIWALPTDKLAARMSKTRLAPLYQHNPVLASHILSKDDIRWDALMLDVMPIYVTGAMTPAKLASTPAAYVVIDEEAKIEHLKRNEAHPVLLLEERTKAFSRRLHIHASTPNTEENIFWRGYQRTDCRQYFVPCPHCGKYQTLEFTRETLVWDHPENSPVTEEIVRRTAHYVCKYCHGTIHDTQRMDMLRRGEWRSTNQHALHSRRGYHINSLYSPYVTFGEFAAAFWTARQNGLGSLGYQNFVNSWQALPYVAYALRVDDEQIPALCDTYPRGTLPLPVGQYHYIVVCYDPGQNATHWVAVMLAKGGAMYVIDWGSILAFSTDEAAGRYGCAAHIQSLSWGGQTPDFGYVDSGDWTQKVYEECERAGGQLYPTKGTASAYGAWNRQPLKNYPLLDLVTYSDYAAKTELYGEIISRRNLADLHLPRDIDAELVQGLSGQVLELMPSGKRRWKDVKNDHLGDCIKLARVSWWVERAYLEPPEPVTSLETHL